MLVLYFKFYRFPKPNGTATKLGVFGSCDNGGTQVTQNLVNHSEQK